MLDRLQRWQIVSAHQPTVSATVSVMSEVRADERRQVQ